MIPTISGKIGIGKAATASLNLSGATGHVRYVDFDGRHYSQGLNPYLQQREILDTEVLAQLSPHDAKSDKVGYVRVRMDPEDTNMNGNFDEAVPLFYLGIRFDGTDDPTGMVTAIAPHVEAGKKALQGAVFYALENGHSLFFGLHGDLASGQNASSSGEGQISVGGSGILTLQADKNQTSGQYIALDGRLYIPEWNTADTR